MINSHGVEISIAGCVEEMVRAQIPHLFFTFFFIFFYFFLFFFIMRSLFLGTRSFVQR